MKMGLNLGLGTALSVANTVAILGFDAESNPITPIVVGDYNYCVLKGSGSIQAIKAVEVDYLLVGGGGAGAGGGWAAGGGGAGGVLSEKLTLDIGTYTVAVGAGGARNESVGEGSDGTQSSFTKAGFSKIAKPGAKGSASIDGYPRTDVGSHASGSGGAGTGNNPAVRIGGYGDNENPPQGNDGGSGCGDGALINVGAGGGGGYGGVGLNYTIGVGGANGGAGVSLNTIFGVDGTTLGTMLGLLFNRIAGGGGGGMYQKSLGGTPGLGVDGGGKGGRGAGGAGVGNVDALPAVDNTGGGGGGSGSSQKGGNGGDGLFIIRWRK